VATVRKGTKSSAQDNFIGPKNVSGVSATNVGSGRAFNDGRIDVSWTNPSAGNTPTGYKVYDGATLKDTISHPTSTAQITGLASGTSYTFTVKAYDSYGEASGENASAVTATTVPATPSAPTATAQAAAANDDLSWSAPSDGGTAITSYDWESNDSKSGNTASTSASVGQEAGTSQSYRVRAKNANGDSAWSAYSSQVTSFSFTPFGFAPFGAFGFTPFGFTPFGAFGFTPFGAFGFTPFGFTPFGAFGFTPFGAFGFTPFSFAPFGFSPPRCIEENTLIDTPNGQVAAKDLQVGDEVYTVLLQEVPLSDETGQYDFDYVGFESDTLTPLEKTVTTIITIDPSTRDMVICFNGEQDKLYSTSQPVFAKSNNKYQVMPTGAMSAGDYLISVNNDGSFTEILIETIDAVSKNTTVYQFNCEPADWFIAGGYLVHNK
jgi:hypothetical protein